MRAILDQCTDVPLQHLTDGTILLEEGQTTGRAYVLASGTLEVSRDGTQVALLTEPGSIVGEMSILLAAPHTATVRASGPASVHVIPDADTFFRTHPALAWLISRLLANRLNAATTYLVDLKRQFEDHGTHLEMVSEVLDALLHQQERDFHRGSNRDPGRS